MRKNRLFTFLSAFAIAISIASCGEDRTHEYLEMTEENQWIYSQMKEVYLWGDDMKTPKREEFFNSTSKFYKSLLVANDKASYFSDSISAGSYGMRTAIMRDPLGENMSHYYALVLFVEKNSPADIAGIRRGDWICSVGGKRLSASAAALLQGGDATTVVTRGMDSDDETGRHFWATTDTLNIHQSVDISEEAVYLDTIYNVRARNIGYIVCNNFNDVSVVDDFNDIILGFIAENVSDVVLDMRYCTGGTIENAATIASMFVPLQACGTPFATLVDKDSAATVHNYSQTVANISDKKLYIVTGNATNGIPELFVASVNATRGLHEVVTLGSTTFGANVVTDRIESPYGFSINPAVANVKLPDGNLISPAGLIPDYPLDEFAEPVAVYPLGDEQEYVLRNIEYLIINGVMPAE